MTATTTTRATPTRALGYVLVALALVAASVFAAVHPAAAASQADYVGMGDHATISGRVGSSGPWSSYTAGEMLIRIDGGTTVVAYCIDIFTSISEQTGHDLPEVPWATSGIANLDQVSYVLHTYVPGSAGHAGLAGTDAQKAAAIQAAIWHLTDGFELRTTSGPGANHANVVANYQAILASIPAEGLPVEPVPSLQLTPPTASAEVGQLAGPFSVQTTGSDLPLVAPAGVEVVDWDTGLPLTTVDDGDQFGVRSSTEGVVEVSASTSATIHAGRVFAKMGKDGKPVVQRLILGQTTTASTSDSVQVTFTQPTTTTTEATTTTSSTTSTTTSTTVPEETTTTSTVPEETTTSTTVPDAPTTTVPEETTTTAPDGDVDGTTTVPPTEVLGEQLPRTGADTTWLLWVALALFATGGTLLALDKRHQG